MAQRDTGSRRNRTNAGTIARKEPILAARERRKRKHYIGLGYSQTVIEEINDALQTNDYSPSRYDVCSDTDGQEPIGGVFMLERHLDAFVRKYCVDIDSPEYIALSREVAKAYKLYLQIGQLRTAGDYYNANKHIASWLAYSASASPWPSTYHTAPHNTAFIPHTPAPNPGETADRKTTRQQAL